MKARQAFLETICWVGLGVVLSLIVGSVLSTVIDEAPASRVALLGPLLLLNLIATAVALRRATGIGVLFGAYMLGIHVVGWTASNPGEIVFAVGFLFAAVLLAYSVWHPSRTDMPLWGATPVWLGFLPWLPALGASLLHSEWGATVARLVLAAGALGVVLASRRASAIPLAWGMVAGVHAVLCVALFSGLYDAVEIDGRFSGGSQAMVHPNILGLAAWTAAVAWVAIPGPSSAARLSGLMTCGVVLAITDSRTATGAALISCAFVALARIRASARLNPVAERGLAVLVLAAVVLGGSLITKDFFARERTTGSGALSGRVVLWEETLTNFRGADSLEKLLGDPQGATGSRIAVTSADGSEQLLTSHNAVLGLLRRAGIVGVAIGAIGLLGALLALWKMTIRASVVPAAGTVAAVGLLAGAIATIPVEAWFFGGSLWISIVVAYRLAAIRPDRSPLVSRDDRDPILRGTSRVAPAVASRGEQ